MDVAGPIPTSFTAKVVSLLEESQYQEYGLVQFRTTLEEEQKSLKDRIQKVSAVIQNMEALLPELEEEKDKADIEVAGEGLKAVLSRYKRREDDVNREITYVNRLIGFQWLKENQPRKRKANTIDT